MTVIKRDAKWSDAGVSKRKIARNQAKAAGRVETPTGTLSVKGTSLYVGDELIPADAEITMHAEQFAAHLALAHLEARQLQAQLQKPKLKGKVHTLIRNEEGRITGMVTIDAD